MKACTIQGCYKKYKAKGFCGMHYRRFRLHGHANDAPIRLCSIEGCGNKHRGLGFCEKHYTRYLKYNDPYIISIRPSYTFNDCQTLDELFEVAVEKLTESGCWIWMGRLDKYGYGAINWNGKEYKAHRLSYQHFEGEIPLNHGICHKCDNPSCVNPTHLFVGTQLDNVRDMHAKKRANKAFGENSSKAILTEANVREIRLMIQQNFTNVEIARKFNISAEAICGIKANRNWRHVI